MKNRNQQYRNLRMTCGYCKAQWWIVAGGSIDPMDHSRPDGRRCLANDGGGGFLGLAQVRRVTVRETAVQEERR